MKTLVKTRLALGAIALASAFAFSTAAVAEDAPAAAPAKEKRAKGERGGRGPMAVLKDLNLTDEQKAKIKEINDAQKTKRQALKNDAALDAKAKRKAQMELREETMKKIRDILTAEQQAKFDAAIAEQKANRKKKDA